jgi:hypothetical protein
MMVPGGSKTQTVSSRTEIGKVDTARPVSDKAQRDLRCRMHKSDGLAQTRFCRRQNAGNAGWSSPVARQAHNLKAAGSNPAPATNETCKLTQSSLSTESSSAQASRSFLRFRSVSISPDAIRASTSFWADATNCCCMTSITSIEAMMLAIAQ